MILLDGLERGSVLAIHFSPMFMRLVPFAMPMQSVTPEFQFVPRHDGIVPLPFVEGQEAVLEDSVDQLVLVVAWLVVPVQLVIDHILPEPGLVLVFMS